MQARISIPNHALLACAAAAAVIAFVPALNQMYQIWSLQPEYSYGFVIPVLSAFLLWRDRNELRNMRFTGSWYGLILVVLGLGLRVIGQLSTMSTVLRYGFVIVFYGLVLSLSGTAVFRKLWLPLAVLIFMVPLPTFISQGLSIDLQLLSSWLGVQIIRAAGISVFLEGNVIDLGTYQLQVADACSGLRYLFPLMTIAFLVAYLFRGAMWKRALIFLASVPVTILMNSLRIGFIGITVELWGSGMAEGTLHDFEGWLVFMLSVGSIILIANGLSKVKGGGTTTGQIWSPARQSSPPAPTPAATGQRRIPPQFLTATVLVVVISLVSLALPPRAEPQLARSDFAEFPAHLGSWTGQRSALENIYLDALQLDDYVLADYHDDDGVRINFYAAYYQSQRWARRVHSPLNCIPGGGWQIVHMNRVELPGTGLATNLAVNRALIAMGDQKALVYYWFQERGRRMTDENMVKWYLFWDSLVRNRTDGALVRIVAPLAPGADEANVDAKMQRFAGLAESKLGNYIPD